uniref:Uncharacterized protein n=1 Tax=viral metagenome TaxID=1070528 RepID=A0A6C0KD95_9ZZZZ
MEIQRTFLYLSDYLPWGLANFFIRGFSRLRDLLSGYRIAYRKGEEGVTGMIVIRNSSPKPILMLSLNTTQGEVSILDSVIRWNHRCHNEELTIKDIYPNIDGRTCNIVLRNGFMEDEIDGNFCVPI